MAEKNPKTDKDINRDPTEWRESPYLMIKGFLMGSADIVPGVSGGTMALITGIYDRLIFAIKSADTTAIGHLLKFRVKELVAHFHWKFLFLLLSGVFLAIVFFTRVVPLQIYMFTHPEMVYGLFFGLILGSIFLLIAEIKAEDRKWRGGLPLVAGAVFGFWVVTLVPADTPETFLFVFLSGAISICAMILPGISGSYILLIFRKYDYILGELGRLGTTETFTALINLAPFILGALTGLILFSRILSWLLRNFHATTLLVLIGFLIGSLYVIWPYQDRTFEESVREVKVLPMSDPLVQELMERDEPPMAPRYQRIGRVLNPDATFEQFRRVEVETVSRNLLTSEPFLPWFVSDEKRAETDLWQGMAGMSIGLVLIVGIAYLRRKNGHKKSEQVR